MRIKCFNSFNESTVSRVSSHLAKDDMILCLCDLLDEGFIIDVEQLEHIFMFKYTNSNTELKSFYIDSTDDESIDTLLFRTSATYEQLRILDIVKVCCGKLEDISDSFYHAYISFSEHTTTISFSHT